MSSLKPRIAFLGATGDCAGFCLAAALTAGHRCVALARTPTKLRAALEAKGVSAATQEAQLTVVEGNAKDAATVARAVQIDGEVVEVVVSGIGGTPTMQWSVRKPVVLTDPTVCQDAGRALVEALAGIAGGKKKKPLIVNVSTTGISGPGKPRDVPLAYVALYHYVLQEPHEDKKVMEAFLAEQMQLPEERRGFGGYVNVKPTLLFDGTGKGVESVRAGSDSSPATGYGIQRKDVGEWMFEKLVRGKDEIPAEWMNGSVVITS